MYKFVWKRKRECYIKWWKNHFRSKTETPVWIRFFAKKTFLFKYSWQKEVDFSILLLSAIFHISWASKPATSYLSDQENNIIIIIVIVTIISWLKSMQSKFHFLIQILLFG